MNKEIKEIFNIFSKKSLFLFIKTIKIHNKFNNIINQWDFMLFQKNEINGEIEKKVDESKIIKIIKNNFLYGSIIFFQLIKFSIKNDIIINDEIKSKKRTLVNSKFQFTKASKFNQK